MSDADRPTTGTEAGQSFPGATSDRPTRMPLAAWWAIIKRVYVMTGFHNLGLLAAGVAFFAFLALVPLMASVVLLYGLLGDPQSVSSTLDLMSGVAPPEVLVILRSQMLEIIAAGSAQKGWGLVLALLFALYGAMQAAGSMIAALNMIYEEHETRSFLKVTAMTAAITLCMVALALTGVLAISLFTYVTNFLAPYLGDFAALLMQMATWLVAGAIVSAIFAVFFRFAPDRHAAKWRWLTLGSGVSTLLWLAVTVGFAFYVANVSNFNATYGSLSAIVVFLIWLQLSVYGMLLGAVINAEVERQTMVDSTTGPDQPIGQRGAVMADNVVIDDASRALMEKRRRRAADAMANRT